MENTPLLSDRSEIRPQPTEYSAQHVSAVAQPDAGSSNTKYLPALRISAIFSAVFSFFTLGMSIWTVVVYRNSWDDGFGSASIAQLLAWASLGILHACVVLPASYVTRFGKRPLLITAIVLSFLIVPVGLSALVFGFIWLGMTPSVIIAAPLIGVTSVLALLQVIAYQSWAIIGIMYHRGNPLPSVPSGYEVFPAVPLRVTSIMLLVNACLLAGLCAFTNIVSLVWAALNVPVCIVLVVGAFIRPNLTLHLIMGILSCINWAYGWAAFAFYIIGTSWGYLTTVMSIVSATFCGLGQIVHLAWIIYALRWYHHAKRVEQSLEEPDTPSRNYPDFPRTALITLSSLSLVAGVGVLVPAYFPAFIFNWVYAPITFAFSINLIIASATTPNITYIFVSAVMILCTGGWSLINLALSSALAAAYSGSYYRYNYWVAPLISEASFSFIQGAFFISWGCVAIRWYHVNRPQRSPMFPSLVMRTLSIACLIFLSSFIISSAVVPDVYVRALPWFRYTCFLPYALSAPQTIIYSSLTTMLAINMTVASFVGPNRVYVVVVAICSCVTLAGGIAEIILAIYGMSAYRYLDSALSVYSQWLIVTAPVVFAMQLVWTIVAFKWYAKGDQSGVVPNSVDNEALALRTTVAQLTATVQTLSNRLEHQQQHIYQTQQAPVSSGYGSTTSSSFNT